MVVKEYVYLKGPYSYTNIDDEWACLQRQKAFILGFRAGIALLAFCVVLWVGYSVMKYENLWWMLGTLAGVCGITKMIDSGVFRLRAIDDWEQQLKYMRVAQDTANANARN